MMRIGAEVSFKLFVVRLRSMVNLIGAPPLQSICFMSVYVPFELTTFPGANQGLRLGSENRKKSMQEPIDPDRLRGICSQAMLGRGLSETLPKEAVSCIIHRCAESGRVALVSMSFEGRCPRD